LQLADIMSGGELPERFAGQPVFEIPTQDFLHDRWQHAYADPIKQLPTNLGVSAEGASNKNVVPFQRFSRHLYFRAEQANVTDVVLGAGIRTTGQMDVDWLIELKTFIELTHQLKRVPLGI
jgi:hypothetical protein